MSTMAKDAIKNGFIVDAQRHTDMTLEEAEALGDFVSNIGSHVMASVMPAISDYRSRIARTIRAEVINEILQDFMVNNGIVWTRNSVLARIRAHLPKE